MEIVALILSLISGTVIGFLSYKKFAIKRSLICIYPLITLVFAALYYFEFGLSVAFWAGIVFALICLYFSTGDIQTRKVSDLMHVLIFALGFVFLSRERLLSMIAGAFLLGLLPLIAAVIKPGCFGGADIKFIISTGWLFGLRSGALVMVLGLLFSIIITFIASLFKQKRIKTAPMIPFFCMAGLLIFSTF